MLAAVYYKGTGAFCAGFIRESDDEFVLMELISPSGRSDGLQCIRIEEILKIDVGSEYLTNLVKVYRYYGEKISVPGHLSKKVLEGFADYVIKSKKLCSMEIGFETLEKISGYVTERDWDVLNIRLLNENGADDGFTSLALEEIVCFGVDSEYEKYLHILEKFNRGETPDGGGRGETKEKNPDDKTVLSFPFGK